MPCGSDGYPPSPYDSRINRNTEKIRIIEVALVHQHLKIEEMENELKLLKETFKLMGNGG